MARQGLSKVKRMIDNQDVKCEPEKLFLADLKSSIIKTEEKNYHTPSQTYKPSSMQCIRAMYYQRMGVEVQPNFNPSLTMICNSGTDTHKRIQQAITEMKENGYDCNYVDVESYIHQRYLDDVLQVIDHTEFETKIRHRDLPITFLCDGIIQYKGKYYVLEIKTENSNKFMRRGYVDSKHFDQAIAYATFLNLPEVLFIYVCRDTLDMKSYIYNVTQTMKEDLIGTIQQCEEYVKNQCPPPVNKNPMLCRYCVYESKCREDSKDECSNE